MESFTSYLLRFTEVPESLLKALLDLFRLITLAKGEHFVRSGRTAKKLGFLEKGVLRAYYQNHRGEEYNKLFFTNPSIVGAYTSMITGEPSQINIECLTECVLLAGSGISGYTRSL